MKMGVQPGNRRVLVSVPEWYVAGTDSRGRPEGRPYPWSQQVIHEISGLLVSSQLSVVRSKNVWSTFRAILEFLSPDQIHADRLRFPPNESRYVPLTTDDVQQT